MDIKDNLLDTVDPSQRCGSYVSKTGNYASFTRIFLGMQFFHIDGRSKSYRLRALVGCYRKSSKVTASSEGSVNKPDPGVLSTCGSIRTVSTSFVAQSSTKPSIACIIGMKKLLCALSISRTSTS